MLRHHQPSPREDLHRLIDSWEESLDARDVLPYRTLLEEFFFHAELRYHDYLQFRGDGSLYGRLLDIMQQLGEVRLQKAFLEITAALTFIDRSQMLSLHRDAFRRVIAPWIQSGSLSAAQMLSPGYDTRLLSVLKSFSLFSITESFGFGDFLHVNDLSGVRRPRILGEDRSAVAPLIGRLSPKSKGIIVLEDFVGTGTQATGVLLELVSNLPKSKRILFVPLIILEEGVQNLRTRLRAHGITIRPVLVIPQSACLQESPSKGEPNEYSRLRSLVKSTARRVMAPLDDLDDCPSCAFGYKGSGALVVTYYNTPNNTLPLIHHRAPNWIPLFRRVHHSKDGLG